MFDIARNLCDVLISHQVTDETSADFGGILCPSCQRVHTKAAEATFPFCYLYAETQEERYMESALRLMHWLSKRQKEDGFWVEHGGEDRESTTVTLMMALCLARQHLKGEGQSADRAMLEEMIHPAAEYIYRTASPEWAKRGGSGINDFASSCPALHLAYAVLGEEKYRDRAKENASSAMQHINEEGFLVGEGDTSSESDSPAVDVACNLERGLGALVVYSCLSGDEEVRGAVLEMLRTHLNFITPSGYIDDSWGRRMHEWTLLGNKRGGGCQIAFLPFRNLDARFQRAGGQNLRYMVKNMMKDGLVATGPHAKDKPDFVPCIEATAARASAVCQTLIYCFGVPLSRAGASTLPAEETGWARLHRSVNVLQVRTSALLCTITAYGAGVLKEGLPPIVPTGGTISHLWHARFGTVQAASRTIYDGSRTAGAGEASPIRCLTPRIEAIIDGEVFSNLFEPQASVSLPAEKIVDDRFEVLVTGRLKSAQGEDSGLTYAIAYRFQGGKIAKEITLEGSQQASARSVEPIVFERGCDLLTVSHGVEIRHPQGSSCILTASGKATEIGEVSRENLIWNSYPGLFALPIVIRPVKGTAPCKISYVIELQDWE